MEIVIGASGVPGSAKSYPAPSGMTTGAQLLDVLRETEDGNACLNEFGVILFKSNGVGAYAYLEAPMREGE